MHKLLRRSIALFLVAITVWGLSLTADVGAAFEVICAIGGDPSFVSSVLRSELGPVADDMGVWGRLALGSSPWLQPDRIPLTAGRVELPADTLPSEPTPAPVQEDHTLLPTEVKAPEDIVPQTIGGGTGGGADGVYLSNETKSRAVDVAAIAAQEIRLTGAADGPQILIIHTHATEAYTMDGSDVYTETDPYRTIDTRYNVVRVGDALTEAFTDAGFSVIHDAGLYDYPYYNGAYTRSYAAVEAYLAAYPSISVVLDVHRDALVGSDGTVYKVVTDPAIGASSQLQIVVGTDESGGEHPNWSDNLALAVRLQRAMADETPSLARFIALRRSHYNQQLSPGYLLLEVGSHGNTLQEALEAARLFAAAVTPTLRELVLHQ